MTHLPTKPLKTAAHRLASLQQRAWLPPALLLLALSSAFLYSKDSRDSFNLTDSHTYASAKNMAIAENLSSEHNFLMFIGRTLDGFGEPTYEAYNRFPIGGYALIKLAILPFGDDLSAKIYAARTLMLLCFAAAALLAYLTLRRLASSRWIALTATLLAFSSAYSLYYNDMISNETIMDLFGMTLAFHGMTLFEQERRFTQLLLKVCASLLLGWHVYALLLPFIAFGLMRELIKARADASNALALHQLKHTALSLLRNRYLTLGVAALLFGISLLTFNFTNEYFALNRETPFTETPSFKSMMFRTGIDSNVNENLRIWLRWPGYIERQFYRIGMSLPYAFSPQYYVEKKVEEQGLTPPRLQVILGIAAFGVSLIGLLFVRRHKILLAALALSGFCWALPMRRNVGNPGHDFESVFYIGVALTLFTLLLLYCRRLSGERIVAALSVAALLVFVASALRMSQINADAQTTELRDAQIVDFENIRNMTDNKAIIQLNAMTPFHREIIDYYLSDRILIPVYKIASYTRIPDFVATGIRLDGLASLTPRNLTLFLYEWDDYYRSLNEIIAQAGEPLIRSDFDVYLNDNALIYVKDSTCSGSDGASFFLAIYPADESYLPAERRRHGFDNHDFRFRDGVARRAAQCILIALLPDYDIARIHTGQYALQADDSTAHLWEGEIQPQADGSSASTPESETRTTDDRLGRIRETIAQAGEPLIRSEYDVYLNDNMLIYAKDTACSGIDNDPFFLAIYPADESDLPSERRRHGFHNLDFYFERHAIRDGDQCIAIAPLPDYDIARIHTGQYTLQADGSTAHLWEGEIHLTGGAR